MHSAPASSPAVERPAQHRVRGRLVLSQARRGELHRRALVFGDEGHPLPHDLALERRLALEAGKHRPERMGVQAPSGHVLRPGIGAPLYHEHALALAGQHVGRNGAGATGSHDHGIEIRHACILSSRRCLRIAHRGRAARVRAALQQSLELLQLFARHLARCAAPEIVHEAHGVRLLVAAQLARSAPRYRPPRCATLRHAPRRLPATRPTACRAPPRPRHRPLRQAP